MTSGAIFAEAIRHVPALLAIWLTIYGAYWMLGMIRWPGRRWQEGLIDKWGSIDVHSLGGFRYSTLALVSLVSFFLELLLIRWIAAEIRVFAYFKSLVLIACFLGFGLGCYLTRMKIRLSYTLVPLIAMVLLVELPWEPLRRLVTNLSAFIGWFSDVHIWSRAYFQDQFFFGLASAAVAMSVVIPLFGLIAVTFIPLGQMVGWYLENSRNGVAAYSVNVAASLAGIWLYTLLCFYSTPPLVWYLVLSLGFMVLLWSLKRLRMPLVLSFAAILALILVGLGKPQWWGEESWKGSRESEHQMRSGDPRTYWSPYQKLTIVPLLKGNETVRYILNTNDSWFQQVMDLSEDSVTRHAELYDGFPVKYLQYNLPYQFYPNPPSVLIAGAGMGNDAAAALRNGAERVVAVEIDPLIYRLGKELHLENPYSSEKVEFHVDDARSFIQNCKEKFDLIVFSILDSHTTSSHYTNIRIDNYVYTIESMRATRELLKPDGLFVMSFSGERPWFTSKLVDVVSKAFGRDPLMLQTNVTFFVVGKGDRAQQALARDADLASFVAANSQLALEEADPITDDWPYLYQRYRGIPVIVWLLSIGLVSVSWFTFRSVRMASGGIRWHFFFLGVAFMLLEVQVISKSALLFGTTWLVNSIVISAILAFILLANLVIARYPGFPRRIAYAGLFGTMILGYLTPTNALLFESALARAAAVTGIYCVPVFFAGLIFISSFSRMGFQAEAFGSNLLGALVGGLLESLSYLTGIQALVFFAMLFYFVSLLTMKQTGEASPESAQSSGA